MAPPRECYKSTCSYDGRAVVVDKMYVPTMMTSSEHTTLVVDAWYAPMTMTSSEHTTPVDSCPLVDAEEEEEEDNVCWVRRTCTAACALCNRRALRER